MFKARSQPAGVPKPKRKSRWTVALITMVCMGPFAFLVLIVIGSGLSLQGAIGGFGGMPVTIPRHMAEFVEYEGDPGWGEKRQGPVPERTHQSKLTSFGVQFRYPDMATLSGPEMWKDKKSKNIYNTDWMSVGVKGGSRYPGETWLDWLANANIHGTHALQYIYKEQLDKTHGLKGYGRVNKDTGLPEDNMATITGDSIYIARNKKGQVTTYIECSTVQHHAAPCRHNFSLEFRGVGAKVYVQYRRPMLEHWQDIQSKVTAIVLGFKHEHSISNIK